MASAAGAADLRSTNVSVTAINVDNTDYYKSTNTTSINGITVNITDNGPSVERSSLNEQHSGVVTSRGKDTVNIITDHSTTRSTLNRHSDSDSEVAQIDFQSTNVNLRPKNGEGKKPEIPRPMSWEGELSDGESTMCIDEDSIHLIDNSQYIIPENLSTVCNISNKHQSSQQPFTPLSSNPSAVRLKQPAPPPPPPVGGYSLHSTPSHSPLLNQRPLGHRQLNVPPTPSPDSAIHSAYSVFSSPSQSPITQRHVTSSLSRNNSDASHSSCCSYSSVSVSPTQQFSPTHSPIQGRHTQHIHSSPLHHNAIYRSIQDIDHASLYGTTNRQCNNELNGETDIGQLDEIDDKTGISQSTLQNTQGISRQQLINSPCPICGDKISGFHYGIFSCESCKGFFKRTVQNRKNYVCLRGAICPVTVTTRKKCPACRFDKCLQCGMKLEAIREDRTRGGRSTYQCSYSIPPSLAGLSDLQASPGSLSSVKLEPTEISNSSSSYTSQKRLAVPSLLQEIMDVEHLWHYNEVELTKLSNERSLGRTSTSDGSSNNPAVGISTNPLLMNTKLAANANDETNSDFLQNLCNIADHRLYKIVKWCKSLPLFKNISIDDQICLLINSWCELLLFSCCFRSISTPGEIKVSLGKSINLAQAREMGLQACIERMLNFTEHLRRLRVDKYEYVAMKVIVLLTSDASELREPEKVRASQEKALQALQAYTLAHYPDSPAKFGELLLRIPDLQRTCQVGKEMLSIKSKEGEGPSFNLLMELLRGDH